MTALSRIGQDVCTFVTREPYGVCLAIAPWNAAMILSIRAIATPLAAGNTVILRSSEVVPGTHYLWGKLFADAGLPAGCLNILHAGRTNAPGVTKRLIEDSRVRHVNFVSVSSTRAIFHIIQLIARLIVLSLAFTARLDDLIRRGAPQSVGISDACRERT